MGRKSSTNVLSRFLSQPAEYGLQIKFLCLRRSRLGRDKVRSLFER